MACNMSRTRCGRIDAFSASVRWTAWARDEVEGSHFGLKEMPSPVSRCTVSLETADFETDK
jgi:hypothetical protein